jgi:hypothetical protein
MDTERPALDARERLLLLFLAADPAALDPVRIQKGMFILAQRTPGEWLSSDARYEFEPYNYGPFAKAIYGDLHALRMNGYLKTEPSWNRAWVFHSITEAGIQRAREEGAEVDPRLLDYVGAVRRFVTDRSFRELLDAVYDEFPMYAVNSVFRH